MSRSNTPLRGIGRFERSLDDVLEGAELVGDALGLFAERPSLLVYPLVGGLLSVCIGLGGLVVLFLLWTTVGLTLGLPALVASVFAVVVVTYLLVAFANTFFLAALVHEVYDYHHGIDLSIVAGMRAATANWWPLFLWATINWTIGLVLRRSSDDDSGSRLLGEAIRTGWTAATFFVIPVILFEGARGRDMLQKSAGHFRDSWGQILAAVLGLRFIGLALGAVGGALGGMFFLGDIAILALPIVVFFGIVGFVVTTTLQGVIKATVYEHLTSEDHDIADVVPEERPTTTAETA
jgi:hypothetical protein